MKTSIATITLAAALFAGSASAMTPDSGWITGSTAVGLTDAHITYTVRDGVATMFGSVGSHSEHNLAKTYLANLDGIDRVKSAVIVN